MKRINEDTFRSIKRSLRFHRTQTVANRNALSLKTVLQVRGSHDFKEYQQQNKAQHPPVKDSLAAKVMYLHEKTFYKEGYVAPPTAHKAIVELIAEVL